jgi:3-oxosteroid 1-dehydrogenase
VIDVDGRPIPGLYAAGNVMASPMGMTYGGAGGTLGPGMVFGYRAGRAAGKRVRAQRQPTAAGASV